MKIHLTHLYGIALAVCLFYSCSAPEKATLTIFCTTDIHGSLFNYDLKKEQSTCQSLAGIAGYLRQVRENGLEDYILLDGGDLLQGQPTNYYFNFIDTTQTNLVARILNDLGYDAAAVGNHDIETGHAVYDKAKKKFRFPWTAANDLNIHTGEPYFEPNTVLRGQGLKITILGLITPRIQK